MSSDPRKDESTDIDFEIIILNISFRRCRISTAKTSRSLCAPADVQVATEALGAHQGNTRLPARPQADV